MSGWLGLSIRGLQATHSEGHPFNDLIGWDGDPHLSSFHPAGYVFIGGRFWLISAAWRTLHAAARPGRLATTGAYVRVCQAQYDGFLLVMVGFLLQRPTIPTIIMLTIVVIAYSRLARSEGREVAARFGDAWGRYAERTPAHSVARPPGLARHHKPAA